MNKGILSLWAAALMTVVGGAQASAMEQSNTVPSSQLITDFALIKDASDPEVTSILSLYKVGAENRGPTLLETSPDETITLSVGQTSVVCQVGKECRLPYVKGGIYRAELKRFNGEVFKTETELPNETAILAPNDNSIVGKNDAVNFSWVVARPSGPRGITLSIFLGEQINTCSTTGFIDWKTEGTAVAPAKYVSTCEAPLRARFGVFYVNPVRMPGVAGGTLKGYSTARMFYTYMDSGVRIERDTKPITREELREMLTSSDRGNVITQTIWH